MTEKNLNYGYNFKSYFMLNSQNTEFKHGGKRLKLKENSTTAKSQINKFKFTIITVVFNNQYFI